MVHLFSKCVYFYKYNAVRMRINDFHNILELVKQDVLHNEAEYLKLLEVVGNNQRYDFRSQLSIYDKNPKATACAKFDYWRERFNRTVMRGQKGIPILEDYGTYKKVAYIFDISQTVSRNRDVNEVNLWRFDKGAHKDVLKEMIKTEGYEESESTLENIFSLSRLYGDEQIDSLSTLIQTKRTKYFQAEHFSHCFSINSA